MSVDGLRALLEAHGYELLFRRQGWVECFVARGVESWIGRGTTEQAALSDALQKACPSALAQALLQSALEQTSAPPLPVPRPVSNPPPSSGPPSLVPKTAPPAPDLGRSLEALATLEQRIRDTRDELGLCSAERQRLTIFTFICEARGHTELFPDDPRIRDGVAVISRLLTEIGKAFWPGSVTALQLHMQPRDLPRHLLGGVATSWSRAAELAERALSSLEHADERRGFDLYGWADPPDTRPPVPDAEAQLLALFEEIHRASGNLDRHAEPKLTGWRPTSEQYVRWVRVLRSLRCSGANPEAWARIAGRLRWWAGRRDPQLASAAKELEAAHVPPGPWSDVEPDPEANGLPADLLDRVRGATSGKKLVFVCNRRDPDLQATLSDVFNSASLEWKVAEPRRLEGLRDEIGQGDYDVVLSALGFLARGADHMLAAACREAGVGYLRVNHGRPIACLRALARTI